MQQRSDWDGQHLGQPNVPRHETGVAGFGSFPTRRPEDAYPKLRELCSRRDLEITKLPENMTRDQYILWRNQLKKLLKQSPRLRGVSKVLRRFAP